MNTGNDFYAKHIKLETLKTKITASQSSMSRITFDDLALRYNTNVRKNGTDKAGNGGNKEQIGVDILQVSRLVADLCRDIVTFNWDFSEKVFTFQHQEDEKKVLDVLASKVQKAINHETSNFATAHSQVVTDWIELGWGVMLMKIKDKRLHFTSLSPLNVNYNYNSHGELKDVFYRRDFTATKEQRSEVFHWYRLDDDRGNRWACSSFISERDKDIEHTYKEYSYQPIFIVKDAKYSEQTVPIGRGLNLYHLIVKANNVYMALLETASQKVNKAIIMDESSYSSMKLQVNEHGDFPYEIPIMTVENKANGLNMGLAGSMQVLDNGADPSLLQWLITIARDVLSDDFSINRLLVKKEKAEMTATEVNVRHTEDKRIIDLATKSFKIELLSPLIFTLFNFFKSSVSEASGELQRDYEIVWNDRETRAEINSRLQEILGTVQIMGALFQFQANFNVNVQPVIEEIAAKTKFTAITGYNKSDSVASGIAGLLENLRGTGNGQQ